MPGEAKFLDSFVRNLATIVRRGFFVSFRSIRETRAPRGPSGCLSLPVNCESFEEEIGASPRPDVTELGLGKFLLANFSENFYRPAKADFEWRKDGAGALV